MAEEEGFEPPLVVKPLLVFETSPFSLLGIPPAKIIITTLDFKCYYNFSKCSKIRS